MVAPPRPSPGQRTPHADSASMSVPLGRMVYHQPSRSRFVPTRPCTAPTRRRNPPVTGQLTLDELTRSTLHRQFLTARADATVPEVIGRLAGLQAQHASWPYVALWTRRPTADVSELESAITDRRVIKATLMRTTLHLVAACDVRAFDVMTAQPRLGTWNASATRAGLDLTALNAEVRAFCAEPRTVAEIEDHLARQPPGIDLHDHLPPGPRNPWFRLGSAGGGLVHVPPSGLWAEHVKPRYVTLDSWLDGTDDAKEPTDDQALQHGVVRYLGAYGPATLADLMQWSGQRRRGVLRAALAALGDRIVEYTGPKGEKYLDLADLDIPPVDDPVPPRFLARWDSVLIGYAPAHRERLIATEHVPTVYKKNGDVLPTFLVDGRVAGLWSYEADGDRATLRIEPFTQVTQVSRRDR